MKMSQFDQSSEACAVWQKLSRQANRDYALQDMQKAQALYEDAMAKAVGLLNHFQEKGLPLSAPSVFVVSCHNLADLLFTQEEPEKAVLFLRRACTELVRLASQSGLPLQARLACVEQLRPAVVALMERESGTLPELPETRMIVDRARTVALSVYQIAGYAVQTRLEDAPVTGRPS
ncbi:hypothetical protein AA14337_1269 [Acetobacter malorum DSM 14337]|uniref:Uncharacterized protein n=2 Tax=Acetobacter malorum TaxID=178901 RepID=A0ABQ0PRZ6_9PROT|nr:hypothetical protein AA14337_1269 [Acetobacter malorum DSM 14337]